MEWIGQVLNKILKIAISGKLIQKTIAFLDKKLAVIAIYIYSRMVKVDPKKIFFITSRGDYDCNAKWIAEEFLRRGKDYKLVWAIRGKTNVAANDFPQQLTLVKRRTFPFFDHISTAKVIIDNSVNVTYNDYKKKKDQILLETWHGSLGIKKFSPETNHNKTWVRKAYKEAKQTDYCISNSKFENDIFRDTYWKKNPILTFGHARNDILFEAHEDVRQAIRDKIYSRYNLDSDVRICLYAPTFRDSEDFSPYMLDYESLIRALEDRFGGKWVIAVRLHFLVRKLIANQSFSENIVDMTDYPDIQEILTCINAGITDYSSWICEYIHTRKPGFIFATDAETYEQSDRELFFPLCHLPFPVARDNDTLMKNIRSFDEEQFLKKCDVFLEDKGCVDDGMAAKRIVDKIEEIMSQEE